jgi:DNA mismatch endonuclease, patch repair protein
MALNRSEQMARIQSKNTAPERILRSLLWTRGYRYRVHFKTPMGRVDVAFPTRKVVIFIDGCFWHGCPIHYVRPRSRAAFWSNKLKANVERDRRQTVALEAAGWRVVHLWEHEVVECPAAAVSQVESALTEERWPPNFDLRVVKVLPCARASEEAWHLQPLRADGDVRIETRTRSNRRSKSP